MKDKEAVNRAAIRRKAGREAQAKKAGKELKQNKDDVGNVMQHSVVSKPSMEQELALFKSIVRQIAQRELGEGQKKMFRRESRTKLRRLAPLGIVGNQAAIGAFCKTDGMERRTIAEAILQQSRSKHQDTESSL